MKKQTKSEKIIAALETLGCKRVDGRTKKYIVFERMGGNAGYYFVGKNGAFRIGESVSRSMSANGIISIETLLAKAERKRQEQAS